MLTLSLLSASHAVVQAHKQQCRCKFVSSITEKLKVSGEYLIHKESFSSSFGLTDPKLSRWGTVLTHSNAADLVAWCSTHRLHEVQPATDTPAF